MEFIKLYILFWIFAISGWIIEMIYCAIIDKKIVNRGFFIGPYCPIYGFGGVSMLLFLPYKDHPIICFVLSMVTCTIIEYLASFLLEKAFKVRWWDYSNDSFNVNGRVCLRNALAFGALGVLVTRYVYPFFSNILNSLSDSTIKIIGLIILVITLTDIIVSFKAMSKIKGIIDKNIESLKNIDATENIKKLIKENLKLGYLEERLIKTYHLLEKGISKVKKSEYLVIFIVIVISIIIGIVLSIVLNNYYLLPLVISIGILISYIISKVVNKVWK